jgi:integration host factor subunit beta
MATITKKDLVDRVAESKNATRTMVKTIVQCFLYEIIAELEKNNRLEFRDFGVFEPKTQQARNAQNPKTLEKVGVPAKRTVKFRAGRLLKEKLNGQVSN